MTGVLRRLPRGRTSRVLWSFADQAVSSGTNFFLTILVARSVTASEFGAFAIGISVYLLCLTFGRSSVSETVVLSLRRTGRLDPEEAAAGLRSTLLVAALAAAVVALAAALVPNRDGSTVLLVLALGLPGLLVQDYKRIVFFALGQPRRAFVSDSVWALLQLGGIVLATTVGVESPAVFLGIWATSALAAGFLWPGVTRGWLRQRALSWLRSRRQLIVPLAGEGLLVQLGNQASIFLLGLLAGLAEVGGYRGAVSLFGPVIVLMLGLRTMMLPELMRLSQRSLDRALKIAHRVALGAAGFATLWGVGLLAMPDWLGRELLGPTWATAGSLIGLITIEKAFNAVGWGAVLRLRVLVRPRLSFALRIVATAGSVLVACIAAPLAGAYGVALGSAIIAPLMAAAWLLAVHRARRAPPEHPRAGEHSPMLEETPGT